MGSTDKPKTLEETLGLAVRVVRDYGIYIINIYDVNGRYPKQTLDFTGVSSEDVTYAFTQKIESNETLKDMLDCTTRSVNYNTNSESNDRLEMDILIESIIDGCVFSSQKDSTTMRITFASREPMRFEGKTFKEILKEKFNVDTGSTEIKNDEEN